MYFNTLPDKRESNEADVGGGDDGEEERRRRKI